jgi:hypothetical protein
MRAAFMRRFSILGLAGLAVIDCATLAPAACAEPLELSVAPTFSTAPSGAVYVPPHGVAITPAGYTNDGWMITHADQLRILGPAHVVRSGVRIGRGSYVPD